MYCHTINVVFHTCNKHANESCNFDVTITKRHYIYDVIIIIWLHRCNVTWWFDSIVIIYYIFNLIKYIVVLILYILVNIYIGAIAWIYNGRAGFIYVRLIKGRIVWCRSFHCSTSRLNDHYLLLLNDVLGWHFGGLFFLASFYI